MKHQYLIFLLLLGLCLQVRAQSNQRSLRGSVRDEQGESLPGVSIRVKGKRVGTMTDAEGRYTLTGVWQEGDIIVFNFMGMKELSLTYTGQKVYNAVMTQDTHALKEVVVMARQNINELDIRAKSGVVQQVDMKRLNSKPMANIGLALQGSIPGLVVTNTGDLGQKPKIRIRGNSSFRKGDIANEPLYVKDGQVIPAETFLALNPMEIKEIKVLKDAVACALYGIKAANGVIEITSLRGNPDGGLTTNYSFNMGITTRGRRGIEMMDTEEKLELERRLQNPAAPGYRYSEDYFRRYHGTSPDLDKMILEGRAVLDSLRGIHTDWFDELIRLNTYQQHNLSVRGGTKKTSYAISMGYVHQGGRVEGNSTQRFTTTLSLDQQLGRIGFLSLGVNAGYGRTDTPNGSDETPADLVYKLNPYETKRGRLYSFPKGDYTYNDLLFQYHKEGTDKRGGLTGSLNLKPFAELSIDAVAGIDIVLNEEMTLVPSTSIKERNSYEKKETLGKLTKDKSVITNISSNIRATYNKVFAQRHDLTLGVNMDYYLTDIDMAGIIGYGVGTIMSPALINHALTGDRRPGISSSKNKTAQLGMGLVAGYSYNEIYDLFATYKVDASSVLPKGKRWNKAWAVGLGWTPGRYSFMKDNNVVTRLNLRASYGQIANLAGVSAEETIGTFSYLTDYYSTSRLLQLRALYNQSLRAEQTVTTDISLSMELFKHLSLEANIYRRETKDALLDVPIPLSNGFQTMKRNIGVLRNEGYEISSLVKILDGQDLRLSLRGSLAYNRNKVVDLYYTDRLYTDESALVPNYEVGKAYDILFGLKSLGINPITGLPTFRGANGEEVPATQNVVRENIIALGHSTPPYSGSLNFSLTYKDFDLDMDFYYVFGGVRAHNYTYIRWADNAYLNAAKGQLEHMWFEKGDIRKRYHSPFYSASAIHSLQFPNTRTIARSDFLRMSMLSLRYRIPSAFLQKAGHIVKYASVAFQASNLFTLTPYSESDPETGSLAGTLQPVLTLNLNLTF
ncbi:SusC/RagA family TonB-linked outer membrane protein [Porphyromonas sp.]|uniref:SusC/RagA family TonB-linked outer membrane protein n=1 Tax=Porphyromonas sp. TaxID=1924944 RepID=UPI0026DC6909|nr:SusC/RagA family TonB-linked outer membrane protein [Porphyromonas sp.]MDO4770792.1 SusC/RagA family TonB-linked outer membrane protein [Porphyromonas sp.]